MLGRQTCVGCGRVSPETNGENTLTTSFGWRLRRNVDDAGNSAVEWRCSNCWQRWKVQQGTTTSDVPSIAPPATTPTGGPPSPRSRSGKP